MAKIVLDNVSVDFPIYGAHQRSLRSTLARRATGGLIQRDQRNESRVLVRALSNVSMTLEEGDRVGLVGHNGSGKSTLLKVLAGIYEPVQGTMTVEGRVTPLFDMMPGLDVEDTGYENLFTAGLLLGMSRDMVESKIEEIEEFSELGEYLSLPVRTYSAGMATRLGFALITALNPDILIMDEGFGAADLRFTEKAAERMDDFIGRSRIMVLASHSDGMLQQICNKAALMEEGKLLRLGPVDEVLEAYHALVHGDRSRVGPAAAEKTPEPPDYHEIEMSPEIVSAIPLWQRDDRQGNGAFRFLSIEASAGKRAGDIDISIVVLNRELHKLKNIEIALGIDDSNGERVSLSVFSFVDGVELSLGLGLTKLVASYSGVSASPGSYFITLFGRCVNGIADWIRYAGRINIDRALVGDAEFARKCSLRFIA